MSPPRVLLVALDNWYGTARLPSCLQAAGFTVGLLSEPQVYVARSRHVDFHLPISVKAIRHGQWQAPAAAIALFAPDFILPADENAVCFLQFLAGVESSPLQAVLQRSLGDRRSFAARGDRNQLLEIADRAGIACAVHAAATDATAAKAFGDRHGWPLYLKRDGTFAGQGVRKCPDAMALQMAYRELAAETLTIWTPRGALRQGRALLRAAVFGTDPLSDLTGASALSVEAEVIGRPAFHTAVAVDGHCLAGISAEVELFHPEPTGPSTRVRLHHDADMTRAAKVLARILGLSGFFGLDFIRQPDGSLVLLEFNQRPTSVAHLGRLVGTDLCAALFAGLRGLAMPETPAAAETLVALYPQDWLRDPLAVDRAPFLADIPWHEPELLAALNARLELNIDATGPNFTTRQPVLAD